MKLGGNMLGKGAVGSSFGPRDVDVPTTQTTSVFAFLSWVVCWERLKISFTYLAFRILVSEYYVLQGIYYYKLDHRMK